MKEFRLAMVQMHVEGGDPAGNLERAAHRVDEAVRAGAQVVLLPETMDLGWTHPSALTGADSVPEGAVCSFLRSLARRHGIYLCSGLTERAGDQTFNAAVLISPAGDVILHHRKLNELDIAHDCYAQGDRLAVAATPLATFGLMICADAFARGQVISRTLGMMGADVILSPCAWAVPSDHDNAREPYGQLWFDNYGPVARDFRVWIAGCSNVGPITAGPWQGRHCIGSSLVMTPDGKPALWGPYGVDAEKVLLEDVRPEPRPGRGDGWKRRPSMR